MKAIPHIGKLMVDSINELLEWSDAVVVTQQPKAEVQILLRNTNKQLLDLIGMDC